MRLEIDATYIGDDEPTRLVAQPIDFVMWERHTGRRMSDLADGIGMEDICYLAWSATRRDGGERPPFDVWIGKLAEIDEADDGEAATPTPPAASDG